MIDNALLQEKNLWYRLEHADKPIVVYGMGNGADKICNELERRNLQVADFFASDGFVRGHSFRGKVVLSLADVEKKYEDFIILVAFGSCLPDVMEKIRSIAKTHELYAPDVPVAEGGALFDAPFYLAHEKEFTAVREMLADDKSKSVWDDMIAYKLSGDIAYLSHADSEKDDALRHILSGNYTAYADLGAYIGDTVEEALRYYPTIQKVAAFEPSARIYKKLTKYLETVTVENQAFNIAAWDKKETKMLTDGSGRNTAIGGTQGKTKNGAKIHTVECDTLDNLTSFQGENLLIKYDVEGAEYEAITGSLSTIKGNDTELIVSLYHRSEDLFSLPLLIHKHMPNHKFYLRKHPYIPAWDINLYVTK